MSKIELLSKWIGLEKTNELAVKYFKACPPYYNRVLQAHYLKQYPQAKIIPPEKFMPTLFSAYYGQTSPEDMVPDAASAFVSAYVPFRKGITHILLFNFCQRNYSIRDPLLIRLSIMKENEHFWSKQYVFKPNEVKYFNTIGHEADAAALPEQGIVLLEVFHPRLKTPENEFRFFVFFHDQAKGLMAGVHSIPAPLKSYLPRTSLCYRGYLPDGHMAYLSNFAGSRQDIEAVGPKALFTVAQTKSPLKGANGFCIIHDGDGIPLAIWHDNCNSNRRNIKNTPSANRHPHPCTTGFYIPNFKHNAPLLRISEDEIGFPVEAMTLKLFTEDGALISSRDVVFQDDQSGCDLAKVFAKEDIQGSVNCVVEFKRDVNEFAVKPICYVHVYYRGSNRLADQTHTESSYGLYNDSNPQPKSYRCLKMAPIFKAFRNDYAIITAGGCATNPDNTITLRIFTDTGTEHVINHYPIRVLNGVAVIHGDDIFKDCWPHIREAGVIWFEHQTTNYNGIWYCIDRETGNLATDHFTGA